MVHLLSGKNTLLLVRLLEGAKAVTVRRPIRQKRTILESIFLVWFRGKMQLCLITPPPNTVEFTVRCASLQQPAMLLATSDFKYRRKPNRTQSDY